VFTDVRTYNIADICKPTDSSKPCGAIEPVDAYNPVNVRKFAVASISEVGPARTSEFNGRGEFVTSNRLVRADEPGLASEPVRRLRRLR
jgi:hypothetical protein